MIVYRVFLSVAALSGAVCASKSTKHETSETGLRQRIVEGPVGVNAHVPNAEPKFQKVEFTYTNFIWHPMISSPGIFWGCVDDGRCYLLFATNPSNLAFSFLNQLARDILHSQHTLA